VNLIATDFLTKTTVKQFKVANVKKLNVLNFIASALREWRVVAEVVYV